MGKRMAFVHCRIMPGGALEVFKDLIHEEFIQGNKEGQIFTLFSDTPYLESDHRKIQITVAMPLRMNRLFLYCTNHKMPVLSRLLDYRNLMFFYRPLIWNLSRKIKRYHPDQVLISSFAVAKNIRPISGVPTKLYLHSPMQYIRSHYDEYMHKLTGRKKRIFNYMVPRLRKRDMKYTKFDEIYANSQYTAKLAKTLYGMRSIVQYPQIDETYYTTQISENPLPYYVVIGRLVNFVRESDIIIKLFNHMKLPLVVIGEGPDGPYLRSLAKENIIFVGWMSDVKALSEIVRNAKGLINLTKESFGKVTAEALLMGVPVFGYNDGASPELVDKDSGILVENKSLPHLIQSFHHFDENKRNRVTIARHIRKKLEAGSVKQNL